jgi:hypothetical protein
VRAARGGRRATRRAARRHRVLPDPDLGRRCAVWRLPTRRHPNPMSGPATAPMTTSTQRCGHRPSGAPRGATPGRGGPRRRDRRRDWPADALSAPGIGPESQAGRTRRHRRHCGRHCGGPAHRCHPKRGYAPRRVVGASIALPPSSQSPDLAQLQGGAQKRNLPKFGTQRKKKKKKKKVCFFFSMDLDKSSGGG